VAGRLHDAGDVERRRIPLWLFAVGPGLMVMLADTDAGSIITAGQSGARWGYRLLLVELLLAPVLYLVMELTVRVGLATGKGHAQLIREQFGRRWAIASVGALLVSVCGALVTEFAGIAGVGRLYGIPAWATVPAAAVFLVAVVCTGSYRRVELIGIALGLFELAFLAAALLARPSLHALAGGVTGSQPLGNGSYLALIAANVGAVVMPWMIFYQQGAVIDKRLTLRDLRGARIDTAIGAVLTQLVMIAVLVAAATAAHGRHTSLNTVGDLGAALTSVLGGTTGRLVLALGVTGAALLASVVVSLAAAWAVAEVAGRDRSLDEQPRQAPLFYGLYAAAIAVGATLVLTAHSLVRLAVQVEIVNALLLPLALGFLVLLAFRTLAPEHALGRGRRVALGLTAGTVVTIALVWVGIALGL
jgi:NRAMP (natural resistance-associated macrophage protein)-like metal ion transporter